MIFLMAWVSVKQTRKFGRSVDLIFGACAIVDLPLTFVGDTLTLPITIPATLCPTAFGTCVDGIQRARERFLQSLENQ
jgi:hypothetical protein